MIIAITWSNDVCFPLSCRGWRGRGPVVSRRERACNQRETNGARTRIRGGWEAGNKERNKCPGCTQPRRWRCVKVEVLSSDLIIYAAGCRGLPLRFTALRKQEQIECWCMVPANRREPNRAAKTAHLKRLSSTIVTSHKCKIYGKRNMNN